MIYDYFVAIVPDSVDLDDVGEYAALLAEMENQAFRAIMGQYKRRPKAILLEPIEWLVTSSPDEVKAFQPDHDCEQCRLGNERASEFLVANPGKHVVCANLHYTEVWA